MLKKGTRQSFLDIGTGSGILAIAAAKLNYHPVRAFDFDPESIRVARANAQVNQVQDQMRITRGDVAKLPLKPGKKFDLICANLISNLLLAEKKESSHNCVAAWHPGAGGGFWQSNFPKYKTLCRLRLETRGRPE